MTGEEPAPKDAGAARRGEEAVTTPVTKTARQARIADILAREKVQSQEQLAGLLRQYGLAVAQATLSRDLDELGVVRLRAADGALVYALPAAAGDSAATSPRLARHLSELLTSAEASANLVVLRTPAGAAQFVASLIDHAAWHSVLGTVAGDDTVLVIARDPVGGDALAAEFLRLAERRRLSGGTNQTPAPWSSPLLSAHPALGIGLVPTPGSRDTHGSWEL